MSLIAKSFVPKVLIPRTLYAGGSIPADFIRQDYLQLYGTVGWWHAVVFRIALGLSEVKWTLYDITTKDKPKQIYEHPLLSFLHLVNPFQTSEEFIALDTIYMECVGESFWVLNNNALGEPGEAVLAYPDKMSIVPAKAFPFVKGYVYGNGAEAVPLDVNEVIHFKFPNPLNQYRGLGQAQPIGVNLDAEKNSDKWVNQFFYNSARPDGVIQFDYNLSDEQFEKLKRQWSERHEGVAKAHRIGLLEGGGKYIQIQNTIKDMDFPNLKLKNRDIILGVEGMPQSVMGISENVNKANAEAGDYTFARWIVKPRLDWKLAKLQEQLIPKFRNSKNLQLGYEEVVPETIDQKRELAESGMRAGYLTINEARKLRGLDSLPDGDVLLIPLNLIPTPIANLSTPPQLVSPPAETPPDNEPPEEGLEQESKGGEGSGNFGHEGRPGEVGGSSEGGGGGGGEKPSSEKPKPSGGREAIIRERLHSAGGKDNDETMARAEKIMQNLPEEHLQYVKEVRADKEFLAKYNKENKQSAWALHREGTIILGKGADQQLDHELGHAVMDKKIFAARRGGEIMNVYSASLKTGKGFPSGYAQTDAREYFAESYAAYFRDPKAFSKLNPPMAKVLRGI